jgi:hypothetical protein
VQHQPAAMVVDTHLNSQHSVARWAADIELFAFNLNLNRLFFTGWQYLQPNKLFLLFFFLKEGYVYIIHRKILIRPHVAVWDLLCIGSWSEALPPVTEEKVC